MIRVKKLSKVAVMAFLMSLSHFQLSAEVSMITDTISPNRFKSAVPIKSFFERTYKISRKKGAKTGTKTFLQEKNEFAVSEEYLFDRANSYKTNHKYVFNQNGLQTQLAEYRSPSYVFALMNFVYSKDNLLKERKSEMHFSDGTRYSNQSYEYTRDNRLQSISLFNIYGGLGSKESYMYDERGNLINYQQVDGDGELQRKAVVNYEMYPNHKIKTKTLKEIDYTLDGFTNNTVISYDQNGRTLSEHQHSDFGKICHINEYDSASRIVRVDYGHTDYANVEDLFKYDDQGRLIFKLSKFKERPADMEYYYYGENPQTIAINHNSKSRQVIIVNGNVIKYFDGKNLFEYKYTFDAQNNWITATEYKNGIPVKFKERQIEYFN